MRLTVNGSEHDALNSPSLTPLLDVLREELGIMSPKPGCRQGGCGACTVLVGGEPRRACLLPLAAVDGADVTTVEGLAEGGELGAVQRAFLDGYAAQCGYCTSGMLLAAHALLSRTERALTRQDVVEALDGHVCRCTGYVNIIAAVLAAGGSVESCEDAG
jgi:aerobic carbon-monoxide dehydrogenase small subunit